MYDLRFKNVCIRFYNKLKDLNIKGLELKKAIMDCTGVHYNSLYNWIKEFESNAINELIEKSIINLHNKGVRTIKKFKRLIKKYNNINLNKKDILKILIKNKLPKESFKKQLREKIISMKMLRHKIKTVEDIQNEMLNENGISMSKSTIYRVCKKKNITYKKIKYDNCLEDIKEQKIKVKNVMEKIKAMDNKQMISVDEMSIAVHENVKRGWSKKGKKCVIKVKNRRSVAGRYSIVMAISKEKIIGFKIKQKSIKTEDFINFIDEIKNENNYYFMDNATIHKSKQFNEFKEDKKINVIYNAPYKSELNPIEMLFSLLRKKIERGIKNNMNDLINIIEKFIEEINKSGKNYLTKIFDKSEKCMNDFIK